MDRAFEHVGEVPVTLIEEVIATTGAILREGAATGPRSQAGVVCDNPARFSSAGQRLMAVILTATAHRGNQPMPETSL